MWASIEALSFIFAFAFVVALDHFWLYFWYQNQPSRLLSSLDDCLLTNVRFSYPRNISCKSTTLRLSFIRNFSSSSSAALQPVKVYRNADLDKLRILLENKKKSGVYRWINLMSGKSYIGSSIDLEKRMRKVFFTDLGRTTTVASPLIFIFPCGPEDSSPRARRVV